MNDVGKPLSRAASQTSALHIPAALSVCLPLLPSVTSPSPSHRFDFGIKEVLSTAPCWLLFCDCRIGSITPWRKTRPPALLFYPAGARLFCLPSPVDACFYLSRNDVGARRRLMADTTEVLLARRVRDSLEWVGKPAVLVLGGDWGGERQEMCLTTWGRLARKADFLRQGLQGYSLNTVFIEPILTP